MKTKILLKTGIALIAALTLCSTSVAAQDKITFLCKVSDDGEGRYPIKFGITATMDEEYTIDWGDGSAEIKSGSSWHWHEYDVRDEYLVTITANSADCKFYAFDDYENGSMKSLDVSGCSALTRILCYHNHLSSLAVCPSLVSLSCFRNRLTHLDLSNCVDLKALVCYENQLTNIDLHKCHDLEQINCEDNQLASLDLTQCPNLVRLSCENNQLASLNLTQCPNLVRLSCNINQLISLNLHKCHDLEQISCGNNQLANLDLTQCPNLVELYCENNQLTNLNFTECPALEYVYCFNNQLQLADLFAAHLLIDNPLYKCLGRQNLAPQTTNIGKELFLEQSIFDGIFTEYIVTKDGNPAPESDYSINNGKLTFNATGDYVVTMTNDAIISHESFPAEVIVPISVWPVGIPENDIASVKVYPNPTRGKLSVETRGRASEKIELFDISGEKVFETKETVFDISFLPARAYFLRINEKTIKIIKK